MIDEKRDEVIMSNAIRHAPKAKKAFSEWLNAIMLCAVAFLLVFIAMAAFTQITVHGNLNWLEIGVQTVIMYSCTVSIHFILRAYARRKGRETERWQKAHDEIERNGRELVSRDLVKRAGEYCRAWEEYDVNSTRSAILKETGLDLAIYEKLKMFTIEEITEFSEEQLKEIGHENPFTREEIKAIKKAKRVRRLHYDENYLSVRETVGLRRHSPSGAIKSKTVLRLKSAQLLATTAITSVFTVSIGAELMVNFSYATLITCLVKLAMLVIFAVFGMIGGYKFATGREVEEMETRADEQRRFFKWCGEEPPKTPKETEKAEG